MKAKINEIFQSIQGEGTIVGYKQLFIRFCDCNLNCKYCDTEFIKGTQYTPEELAKKITQEYNLSSFHSISLTGGEPLLQANFLTEFLPLIKKYSKIYLETNATLYNNFEKIKDYVDIVAADIKLKSATGIDTTDMHKKFFEKCINKNVFAKIVFDNNISEDEITKSCDIANKFNIPLVLQPKMDGDIMSISSEFCNRTLEKFTLKYPDVRLIPQVHKILNIK